MSNTLAQQLLRRGLNGLEQKLNRRLLERLEQGFDQWQNQRHRAVRSRQRTFSRLYPKAKRYDDEAAPVDSDTPEQAVLRGWIEYVGLSIDSASDQIDTLDHQYQEFRNAFECVPTERQRRQLILDLAQKLGADRRQLRGDARAFSRWFHDDAVSERYRSRRAGCEQQIAFYLNRLGTLAGLLLTSHTDVPQTSDVWNRLELERLLEPMLERAADPRVHQAAISCLRLALHDLPKGVAERIVTEPTRSLVTHLAIDTQKDPWVQSESLRLLKTISPISFAGILRLRLTERAEGDDLFVRRRVVHLMAECLPSQSDMIDLIPLVVKDPSPFVRQALARAVFAAPAEAAGYWMHHLAFSDPDPKVRAAVLVEALQQGPPAELHLPYVRLLIDLLDRELDPFVLRVALHSAAEWIDRWTAQERADQDPRVDKACREDVLPAVGRLLGRVPDTPTRHHAKRASEHIVVCLNEPARQLRDSLGRYLLDLPPGKSRRLPRRILRGYDDQTLGRVLAVLAQDDFGFDLERHWWGDRITRGPVFRFRLWRLIHELRNPSPDKRQAIRHTVGRVSNARLRAPSPIMAELSETKVPGEPLAVDETGTWRPHLPLVDDLISAIDLRMFGSETVSFYTTDGVTELTTPRGPWAKGLAYLRLSLRFAHYARLRNWREGSAGSPKAYLQAIEKLGFRVRCRAHAQNDPQPIEAGTPPAKEPTEPNEPDNRPADGSSHVATFFPIPIAMPGLETVQSLRNLFMDYAAYFTSIFDNSLPQLMIFTAVAICLFLGKHLHANGTLRRARKRLPLSIGGWGTRGKSGTERLKAALLNAMGHGIFSKSSGCEAMFLFGRPFDQLHELFLYRPYDKATIWEHRNAILLASRLKSSTFLWECMGLTPEYVDVLQRQWTQDDLATITNTYPDHENLQGPSGRNVAETIAGFIPAQSTLITSEQQMRPVLEWTCQQRGTACRAVGWLQAGLLTDDVLSRFPYAEHPENIALVAAVAEELGCDPDFALKEMADRLVPDLGVLKTYPPAPIRTRVLEFTNGMSANERFGCLTNWQRMQFDRHRPESEPGTWITTVVNNRADRISRSRAFAGILVNDIQADRHFLIGNNLKGLLGYIWEAWETSSQNLSLWADSQNPDDALATLEAAAERFRVPTSPKRVQAALEVMLAVVPNQVARRLDRALLNRWLTLWGKPDELATELETIELDRPIRHAIINHLKSRLDGLRAYEELVARVRSATPKEQPPIDADFREFLRDWFERKLVVLDDYHAPGEQVINEICETTPPGFRNRIMGMQNIKGTGLDFVYRWQAWEKCHRHTESLRHKNPSIARRGLRELTEFQDFGLLCAEHLRQTLQEVKRLPFARREEAQAEFEVIEVRLESRIRKIETELNAPSQRGGFAHMALGKVEEFLDVSDAIRRRQRADQIYRDLAKERISAPRAVLELRALNKRQKGGWLETLLRRLRKRLLRPNTPPDASRSSAGDPPSQEAPLCGTPP